MSEYKIQYQKQSPQIDDHLKNINSGFEKAQKNQEKRLTAEQLKNFYYQNELKRMQKAIDDLTSERVSSLKSEQQLRASNQQLFVEPEIFESPLLEQNRNEELQRQMLDDQNQPFQFQILEQQDEEDEQQPQASKTNNEEISESLDDFIKPKYNRKLINQFKNIDIHEAPNECENQEQYQPPKQKLQTRKVQGQQKNQKSSERIIAKPPQKTKEKIVKQPFKVQVDKIIGHGQRNSIKENIGIQDYDQHHINSDLAYTHLQKRNKLEYKVQKIKSKTREQLNQTKQSLIKNGKSDTLYNPRGIRDQAEIDLYGRPLPCFECSYYLSQGQSSDYCPFHGRVAHQIKASRQMPNRFSKYL